MQLQPERRYPILVRTSAAVHVTLVGCGGTGSFLALHLARLAYHLRERWHRRVHLAFVDPDRVELRNVGRQNFAPAEVGQNKAWALMQRCNRAFGLDVVAQQARFSADMIDVQYNDDLRLVVGCVDNNAARRDIHDVVAKQKGRLWWLDCGNHRHSGQVLLGNREDLTGPAISPLGYCVGLPLPSVQHPDLLEDEPGPAAGAASCAELALADAQGLMINQALAAYAAQYVYRLAVTRDLDLHATYINLAGGSARSMGNCGEPTWGAERTA